MRLLLNSLSLCERLKFRYDIQYWQSPLLFCGLFDFFALWLASDVSSTELRLQVKCDLMTFGDTLRDGYGTFTFDYSC